MDSEERSFVQGLFQRSWQSGHVLFELVSIISQCIGWYRVDWFTGMGAVYFNYMFSISYLNIYLKHILTKQILLKLEIRLTLRISPQENNAHIKQRSFVATGNSFNVSCRNSKLLHKMTWQMPYLRCNYS